MQIDENGLVRWHPAPPPLGPRTVAEVMDRGVSEHPDRLALIDEDSTLTYAELDAAANRAAHLLLADGMRPGARIAACLPNCNEAVVLFLAAMRIGAIWVGINRALSPPEQRRLVSQSGATVFLGETDTVDRLRDQHGAAPATRPDIPIDPFAPAGIAYTSGTTGEPKGVAHSQHNLLLPGIVRLAGGKARPASRLGVALPLTILNLMILGPISSFVCGSTCVLMRRIDTAGLVERIHRDRVESVALPPTSVYDLLHSSDVTADDLASLTDLGVGGMSTPPGLIERYQQRFGRGIQTSYGLTEAPTAVTTDDRPDRPPNSSGLPLAHVQIQIRDAAEVAQPPGVDGDIWVGPRSDGPFAGVYSPMLGYWRQPRQTRTALRPGGWLWTGDRGELADDGSLIVSGRRNDVILRGGTNVYPAEIEQVLAGHPDVAEAVVVGKPDERLGEVVVAVIRWRAGSTATTADLMARCEQNLARYKHPARIVAVDQMPRNAMQKVVRGELRRMVEQL